LETKAQVPRPKAKKTNILIATGLKIKFPAIFPRTSRARMVLFMVYIMEDFLKRVNLYFSDNSDSGSGKAA
jgi:hypothetical protein